MLDGGPLLEWRRDGKSRWRRRDNTREDRRVPRRHPPPAPPFQGGEKKMTVFSPWEPVHMVPHAQRLTRPDTTTLSP